MAEFTFDKHILSGVAFGGRHERANPTENYVCCPPAAMVMDSQGGCWTLGTEYITYKNKKNEPIMEWNVLRNQVDMDITCLKIEVRKGRVWIFTPWHGGWKQWSYNRRHWV